MAPSFFMYCYPWDLDDEGVELAIGTLAGRVGVDAVAVAASLYGLREHRGRQIGNRRTVEYDAAVHFRPSRECYANTRFRPVVAPWMKSRNPLQRIADEALKQGIRLRAWAVCCHNNTLVARYPSASCVDVFGDPVSSWLCPSNPDVREYVAALVADLSSNYPVQTIEVEAAHFGHGGHAHRHVSCGVQPDEAQRTLLGWCFCASCRQRARQNGIDADAVAAKAQALLAGMYRLEPAPTDSAAALIAADEALLAYHHMRVETVASLVEHLRSRTETRLVVRLPDAAQGLFDTGLDPIAVRRHSDAISLPLPAPFDQPARQVFEKTVAASGGPGSAEVTMACHPPRFQDGPTLVAEVKRLAAQGHAAIGFSNYGTAPEPCLDWVRQAIRFARREGG